MRIMQSIVSGFIFLCICHISLAQDSVVKMLDVGSDTREYRLFTPSIENDEKLPLVLNFHGFGSNAIQQEIYSEMNILAETEKFLVAYPEGLLNSWNVGWVFGTMSDDVEFTAALIDELIATENIDPDRVYATGMSNGGFMSYRLACELNDKIAAIASVTGSMVPAYIPECIPAKAVPVLQIHGTSDETVPYEGFATISISMDSLMSFWTQNNGCDIDPVIEALPDVTVEDLSAVEKITYQNCEAESEVILYRVIAGEHTWPGANILIGVTNQDISATTEIWQFFKRHTLQNALISGVNDLPVRAINISPNPTIDYITISDHTDKAYLIYRADGLQMKRGIISSQDEVINISQLNNGIYHLVIIGEKVRYTAKILKHSN